MIVRYTRLSTVGDRTFPVAAAGTWNSLPQHITSASSLSELDWRPVSSSHGRFPYYYKVPSQWLVALNTSIVHW